MYVVCDCVYVRHVRCVHVRMCVCETCEVCVYVRLMRCVHLCVCMRMLCANVCM